MTLLFTDGFDTQDFAEKWVSGTGTWTGLSSANRFGSGYSVNQNVNATVYYHRMFGEKATVVVGFAFKMTSSNTTGFSLPICSLWGDARATQHIHIGVANTTNKIEIRRGNWTGTLLATSATAVIPTNAWCYVEVKATLHDSTGSVEVKLDNAAAVSVTGADTKNGGTLTTFSSLMIGSNANFGASNLFYWDDLYICDTTDATGTQGAAFNDFLGDVRIRTLLPSAAGASTQLTPSTGSNYDNVNDVPMVTTTYNYSSTSGHRDTYALPDPSIPGTESVLAVVTNTTGQRDNTTAISMKAAVKSSSSVGYGASTALATARATFQDVFGKDPATSAAWANSAIDAMEIGVEVV